MEMNPDQWFVRWFFWSLVVWDQFFDTDTEWEYREKATLCEFVDTIAGAVLVLALHIVAYGAVVAALAVAPIYFFGISGYVTTVGSLAVVVGMIFLMVYVRQLDVWKKVGRPVQVKVVRRTTAPKGPSFFKVMRLYFTSVKQKFCPVITFKRQVQE